MTPILGCYVVRCAFKNGHQKEMYLDEIAYMLKL